MATMTFKLGKEHIDELRQLVSDVNDANLYGMSQLEERIDALERRIEQLENHDLGTAIRVSNVERKLNHKSIETSGESIKIADESIKIGGGE